MDEHRDHNLPPDDALAQATAAMRAYAGDEAVPDQIATQTLQALRAANEHPFSLRERIFTMKSFTKLAIAASIAIVVGALVFGGLFSLGGHMAFADVIDRVKQSGIVRFHCDGTMQLPQGGEQKISTVTIVSGDVMRQDL